MLFSYVRRLAGYLRRSSLQRLTLYLSCLIISALGGTAVPLLFRNAVDRGLLRQDASVALFWTMSALAAGLSAVATTAAAGFLGSAIGGDLTFEMRRDLYRHLSRQPIGFFARSRSGTVTSRITHDANDAKNLIQAVLGTVVGQGMTLITAFIALLALSPLAAFTTLAAAPLLLVPVRLFGRRLRQAGRSQAEARAAIQQHVQEHLNTQGALARQIFDSFDRDQSSFELMSDRMRQAVVDRNRYFYISSFLLGSLGAIGVAAVYVIAAEHGSAVSVGTVIALAGLVQLMYQPLIQLATQGLGLDTAIVALQRVFEVLDLNPASTVRPTSCRVVAGRPRRLALDGVWYRHPGDEITLPSLAGDTPPDSRAWTLHDLSIELTQGMTAIVGTTGAGKTTTALVAAGVYLPTRGRVMLDGHPLGSYDAASLRKAMAVISQDVFLLHASLRDNLRLGAPEASDEQLINALRSAHLDQLLDRLPSGLDTAVGDRGYRLSGGERQRLALARALLQQPSVIILDEATAHLDVATERAIGQTISEHLRGTIRLVIAHRLSTIRDADQILVMQHGTIVERGNHETLLEARGRYYDLYNSQSDEANVT